MNNIFKGINNHTCYFFNDIINIKYFDSNKIKADKKTNKIVIIYCSGHVTDKDWKHVKINSVNLLYHIINNVNGYIEDFNKNKYLILVPTNKSKKIIIKAEF